MTSPVAEIRKTTSAPLVKPVKLKSIKDIKNYMSENNMQILHLYKGEMSTRLAAELSKFPSIPKAGRIICSPSSKFVTFDKYLYNIGK
jgi:hypothetical protein